MQLEEQRKIDDAKPLTEEEQKEKRVLLTRGFTSWSKIAFNQFVKANLKFGRLAIAEISNRVKGIIFQHNSTCPMLQSIFIYRQIAGWNKGIQRCFLGALPRDPEHWSPLGSGKVQTTRPYWPTIPSWDSRHDEPDAVLWNVQWNWRQTPMASVSRRWRHD